MRMSDDELARMLDANPDIAVGGLPQAQPGTVPPQAAKFSEHDFQTAVIAECKLRALHTPEYDLMFSIPNGGHRYPAVAAKLKAEGVQSGIPDLLLCVPSRGLHGMFIELKVGKNRLSLAQLKWMDKLRAQGYFCIVAHDSVESVMRQIEWYLEQEEQ